MTKSLIAIILGLFLLALWALWAASVQAATYWASTTGGAASCVAASGTSDPGQYRTLAQGTACLASGDTLKLKAGTYAVKYYTIPLPASGGGSWATATTITTASGNRDVTFTLGNPWQMSDPRSWIIFDHLIWDGTTSESDWGLQTSDTATTHHIRVQNSEIKNFRGIAVGFGPFGELRNNLIHDNGTLIFDNCVYFTNSASGGAPGVIIDGNTIYNCAGAGIQLYTNQAGQSTDDSVVSNNVIHDTTTSYIQTVGGPATDFRTQGIILASGSNIQVYNNVVYHIRKTPDANNQGGIVVCCGASNTKIYSNTIYDINGYGINIGSDSAGGAIVKNNIVNSATFGPILDQKSSTVSNNLTSGNPLFVNAGNADFHLQSNSPAIDAGANLGAPYNVDLDGNARGFSAGWDAGAYEYIGTSGPPVADLVAQFSFDEGSGTTAADTSGLSNNATLQPGASWTPSGKYGKALSLNGNPDSYAAIAYATSLNLNPQGMTLEAWVNPSQTVNTFKSVIAREIDGPYYWLYGGSESYLCSSLSSVGGFNTTINNYACNDTPLPVGQWTHLAVTYDGKTITLYRNGVPINTRGASENLPTSLNRLLIGASAYAGEYFNGLIDEVRVWSRPRTPSEIITDMNTPITPVAPVAPPGIVLNSANSIKVYSGSVKVYVP